MVYVTIQIGKGYIDDLAGRMDRARPKISQSALAQAADMDVSQVSRLFTKNKKRRSSPTMATVERLEAAMVELLKTRRIKD